jgi:hypothetical protein
MALIEQLRAERAEIQRDIAERKARIDRGEIPEWRPREREIKRADNEAPRMVKTGDDASVEHAPAAWMRKVQRDGMHGGTNARAR